MKKFYLLLIGLIIGPSISFSQCEILASQTEICEFQTVTLLVDNPNTSSIYAWDIGGDASNIITGDTAIFSMDYLEGDSLVNIILLQDGSPCNTIDIQVINCLLYTSPSPRD